MAWYPQEKIAYATRKLLGDNPSQITADELRLGHARKPAFKVEVEQLKGGQGGSVRGREG